MRMTTSTTTLLLIGLLSFLPGQSSLIPLVFSSSFSRREWIGTAVIGFPTSSWAFDSVELIRRGASAIPGYGPSDIFYPLQLTGRWNVTQETSDAQTYHYDMRFLPSTTTATACIQDRGYNLMRLETVGEETNRNSVSSRTIVSYEWSESNPNDVRLVLMDGSKKEIKVTKRATERTEDTVTSSEFLRITSEDMRGIPVIQARRVLTKWKIVSPHAIEGMEIVYDMSGGNLGDPLSMNLMINPVANPVTVDPTIISKSRLHLVQLP